MLEHVAPAGRSVHNQRIERDLVYHRLFHHMENIDLLDLLDVDDEVHMFCLRLYRESTGH